MRNRKIEILIENKQLQESFENLWKLIQKNYQINKYILPEEELNDQFSPQSNLIHIALKPEEDKSELTYACLMFQKIHFHLKNYLLKLRKKNFGYRKEFLDILYDIFIDNFLIFKEISMFIQSTHYHFLNIWFDAYFIGEFNKLIEKKGKNFFTIQPQLFFIILLYLSLPKISKLFKEIPFTSIMTFHREKQHAWNKSLELLQELDFNNPNSQESNDLINHFLFNFFDITLVLNQKNELEFDENSNVKCVSLIKFLESKSDELIENISKMRDKVATKPVK